MTSRVSDVSETEWVLLAYRMPREPSTPRIAVWRKLRRLGAVQLVDGFVALPADPATVEAFDWLADEVIEAGGEAWTWRARPGSKRQQEALRARVAAAVIEEYRALIDEAKDAGTNASRSHGRPAAPGAPCDRGSRPLRCPRARSGARRDRAADGSARCRGGDEVRWATRPGCHVDRAACAWLLRRFVDPDAEFVFVEDPADVPADATAFDMRGVELSHHNGDCSFETILRRYALDDPVLWELAALVHEADLADERYDEPGAPGLDAICRGLTLVLDDDRNLEVSGAMFDGLYEHRRRLLRGDRPG